jgi:ribose-phosphate pyrophosphokinase
MIVRGYNKGQKDYEGKPRFSTFPDGQPHVHLNWEGMVFDKMEIHCSIRNPMELFQLGMVYDVIRYNGYPDVKVFVYWLFGARMDRRIDETQPNTFELVKQFLPRSLPPCNLFILDLHNTSVFPDAREIPLNSLVQLVTLDFGPSDIYFPDSGAKKRYAALFAGENILSGKKVRNPADGKLSGFELDSGERKSDNVLIWDDICDGGGTFLGQLNVLKALGYTKIGLYTTHGIYSKGIEVLKDFDAIYTTSSYWFGAPGIENILTLEKYQKNEWKILVEIEPSFSGINK